MKSHNNASIIVLDKFIQATRDSGYKGTYSAISELVDNSIQAGAKNVRIKIHIGPDEHYPMQIAVLDDGSGMNVATLREALRFGGSSRFNDRAGMGRYGMGLPNSSLSQAKKVEVYTWQNNNKPIYSYLDVDEIASGKLAEVPLPIAQTLPEAFATNIEKSGTLVLWSQCDRLSNRKMQTIAYKLEESLGRIFRYYIWDGINIYVNGKAITAIDPIFYRSNNGGIRASLFGDPMEYEIGLPSNNGGSSQIGKVIVRFTELPVHEWHDLPNEEKRTKGISNNAGVSIVRANREIDFGWFFMGSKRRENYDDWWRCEIKFDPILDEAFGITHTKQQIRPQEYLNEILTPDIENIAKALNYRVRQAHLQLKTNERSQDAEQTAIQKECLLTPLPQNIRKEKYETILTHVESQDKTIRSITDTPNKGEMKYSIREAKIKDTSFYCFAIKNGHFILIVNPEHPFYKKLYSSLTDDSNPNVKELRCQLDLMLLAAARAEAMIAKKVDAETVEKFRHSWSNTLATFFK